MSDATVAVEARVLRARVERDAVDVGFVAGTDAEDAVVDRTDLLGGMVGTVIDVVVVVVIVVILTGAFVYNLGTRKVQKCRRQFQESKRVQLGYSRHVDISARWRGGRLMTIKTSPSCSHMQWQQLRTTAVPYVTLTDARAASVGTPWTCGMARSAELRVKLSNLLAALI